MQSSLTPILSYSLVVEFNLSQAKFGFMLASTIHVRVAFWPTQSVKFSGLLEETIGLCDTEPRGTWIGSGYLGQTKHR